MSSSQVTNLSKYTACDISDALHQLQTPGSGFIPDLVPYGSLASRPLVGRASTVLFTDYDQDPGSRGQENVQINKEWVDSVEEDTVVIMSQPEGQQNAILGGIKAVRLAQRNIRGVVVHGRVRDIEELGKSGLTIWAKGTSTVNSSGLTRVHSLNVPLAIRGLPISPGDIVFGDPNGVVVIPQSKLDKVLELLPGLVRRDNEAMEAVRNGMSVTDAFRKFRRG